MQQLKKHSKLAIIQASSALALSFPHIYESGLKFLEKLGFETVSYPTTQMDDETLYLHPELRAKDINDAFSDPDIDGIVSVIGGYESVRVLDYLDMDLILKNPKFMIGFSDTSTFLSYLATKGMKTFYGPSVMAGFAQADHFDLKAIYESFLLESWDRFKFTKTDKYCSGYLDWSKGKTAEINKLEDHLQMEVYADAPFIGEFYGGCIEVMEMLKATQYFPEISFFDDKILFFETSEDKPSPMHVGCMLRNYGSQGILHKINGIVFGRCYGYTYQEFLQLKQIVFDIVRKELKLNLNIAFNLNIGHTDPQWIIPYNTPIQILSDGIQILENPWRNS